MRGNPLESVTTEESPVEECTCAPFTIVRYRDQEQEPSFVDGEACVEVVGGVLYLFDGDELFLFAAPLDAILSVEKVA